MSGYLLMSDPHFHDWSAFATQNEDGVNSRLQITIDETFRAADMHVEKGGAKQIVIAGDVFHTRGSVKPSVLNPVMDMFNELINMGFGINVLAGNHDLEGNDANRLTSAVTALEACGVRVYNKSMETIVYGMRRPLALVPWFKSIERLKEEINSLAVARKGRRDFDLIIHAPVDDVIIGLPNHGLDATYLASLGFHRVFAGHYHHHKDFGNDVYSIGATTHQTFNDIDSKAGFLSVFDDKVIYHASHAPCFVDINEDNFKDAELLVDGNYVRCRIKVLKESDVIKLREQLTKWGAKGVVINQVKDATPTERDKVVVSGIEKLEVATANFIKAKGFDEEVEKMSMDILNEVTEMVGA